MNVARSMPVELTKHISLHQRHSMDQLFGMSSLTPYYSLPKYGSASSTIAPHWARVARSPSTVSMPSYSASVGTLKKKKKRVVFADTKGLALTAVRVFAADSPLTDTDVLRPISTNAESSDQSTTVCFRLGFPQPSADHSSFFKSLLESMVRLESCKIIGRFLIGNVRVCDISQDITVHICITFDSWRSQQDILCIPIQKNNVNLETKLLIFNVLLPSKHNLEDRIEFRISFRTESNDTVLWDDNKGQNYQILVDPIDQEQMVRGKTFMAHQSQHSSKKVSALSHPVKSVYVARQIPIVKLPLGVVKTC